MYNFVSWLTEDLCNFLVPKWATSLTILCLWNWYIIFIHRDRKLSLPFYVFLRVTQPLHRNRQVFRGFTLLNERCNFYWVDFLCFPGTLLPIQKQIYQSTQHAFHSQKQQKYQNRQKSTSAKIPRWWCYVSVIYSLVNNKTTIQFSPKVNRKDGIHVIT